MTERWAFKAIAGGFQPACLVKLGSLLAMLWARPLPQRDTYDSLLQQKVFCGNKNVGLSHLQHQPPQ